jgi:predicted dehydrogenase
VRIVFANGARANATASRVSLSPMRRFRLFSADSYVSLDFTKNLGLLVRKGPEWERRRAELLTLDPGELAKRTDVQDGVLDVQPLELAEAPRPLEGELDAFLRAARGERAPAVSGADALAALELADRIAAAIRARTW